jgi:hypothetical protein
LTKTKFTIANESSEHYKPDPDWKKSTNILSNPPAFKQIEAAQSPRSQEDDESYFEGYLYVTGGKYRQDKLLRCCERYDF